MKPPSGWRALALGAVVATAFAPGCGGGAGGDLEPAPLTVAKPTTQSGDQQSGPVNAALGEVLRVLVTPDGVPESGATVAWSAAQGSVSPASDPTSSDGISSTTWTVGPSAGAQTAQAEVAGATDRPSASAPPQPRRNRRSPRLLRRRHLRRRLSPSPRRPSRVAMVRPGR
jgi:hypothetical protein